LQGIYIRGCRARLRNVKSYVGIEAIWFAAMEVRPKLPLVQGDIGWPQQRHIKLVYILQTNNVAFFINRCAHCKFRP